ncbi:MAG: thermonuclease family protein, partial [Actinomycetota bacterium]
MLRLALVVLVILSACATTVADPTADARIVEIIDGDTLVISVGGRRATTRLIGIDTPETKKPDTPVECYGPEATEFL